MKDTSLSEKALAYTQKFHDRDPNYFQSKYNRRKARQGYIDLYKLNQKKGEDIWNHVFRKFLKKNKLKREDFLETRVRRPQFSDLKAVIKPAPQGPILEKHPVEIVNEEIQQQQSSQPVQEQPQIRNEHIEPAAVEAAFEGLWTIPKLWWPLESLTKEEKEALGRMWLPAFRKYLSEHLAYIGLPLLATTGIFAKHIKEARDKKKEKDAEQEKSKKSNEKLEDGNV